MLIARQNTEAIYERMFAWGEDDAAYDVLHKGTGLSPGEGLMVMEIQQRTFHILLNCIELILQDLPFRDNSVPEENTDQQLSLDDLIPEWPSLRQEVEEAPYKVPDVMGIDQSRTFIATRKNQADDHI